jgi:hypothetical protein
MPPRLWQRQPGEAPADFTAFISYLRLKGRRSHRAVAAQTGRSLGVVRRLSARFNWRSRVAAFEARLADASQDALDLLVRTTAARTTADFERLRMDEFQLFQRVVHESRRWLQLASDPRRRDVSLGQICTVIELAFKLGRLAVGMPTGDEPRRPRKEDTPGYWTGPSVEDALKKIYGSPLETEEPDSRAPAQAFSGATEGERRAQPGGGGDSPLDTSVASSPVGCRAPVGAYSQSLPSNSEPGAGNLSPSTAGQPPAAAPENRRRDAWASWSRLQRRSANASSG